MRDALGQHDEAARTRGERLVPAMDLSVTFQNVKGLVLVVMDVKGAGRTGGIDELGQGEPATGVFRYRLHRDQVAEEPVCVTRSGVESVGLGLNIHCLQLSFRYTGLISDRVGVY